MPRHGKEVEFEIQQLRQFAEELRKIATHCDATVDLAGQLGKESLTVTHWKTAHEGIDTASKKKK